MNDNILKMIKKCRAVFKDEGRSDRWKAIKKTTNRQIKKRRRAFNEEKKERMMLAQNNEFHKCVKSFANTDNKGDGVNFDMLFLETQSQDPIAISMPLRWIRPDHAFNSPAQCSPLRAERHSGQLLPRVVNAPVYMGSRIEPSWRPK